jgi:hypothetical protein
MKKILTIAATALLSTIAGAAHADTVSFGGSIASSCNMVVGNGALVQSGNSLITTAASGFATAKVTCNGNNTLGIAVNTATPSKLYNGTAVASFGGGDGVYSGATGTTFTTTTTTTSGGDTAKIGVVVSPTTAGQLLQKGTDYNAVVDVTLTAL